MSKEKTPVIEFTRFETEKCETFTFLGFEYRWGLSRKSKPLVEMRTAKKKFTAALAEMGSWIKSERCKLGTTMIMEKLRAKLQEHYNYYGVSGNYEMLSAYYHQMPDRLQMVEPSESEEELQLAGFQGDAGVL